MAIDAAAADRQLITGAQADAAGDGVDHRPASARTTVAAFRTAGVAGLIAVLTTAGLVGWLGYRLHQSQETELRRSLFLEAGRQCALDLTTIDSANVDADMRRVLDSATGTFRQDFQQRSPILADVVRKAQSKTEGSITEAGLEFITRDSAKVLVVVAVKTSHINTADQPLRQWRMLIDLREDSGGVKVSNVRFVR